MSDDTQSPVFFVGGGHSDPREITAEVVGGKAYSLMRLDALGLPVPPAFVLPTGLCRAVLARDGCAPDDFLDLLAANVRQLENATGRTFGGHRRPLLVSVRSGAPVSMPGMLETLLNIGLNDTSVAGLIRMTGNPRLAWDSYRRLVEGYATVVRGWRANPMRRLEERHLRASLFPSVRDLDAAALRDLTRSSLELLDRERGGGFPQDPMQQLADAVLGVFRSWRSPKAVEYRRMNGLDDEVGTAATVQAMVFGNAGGTSGSGVGFTRDPATGRNDLYLDFLFDAQGEDVVAGRQAVTDTARLALLLPDVVARLQRVKSVLEAEFHDVQDFEFTVQEGDLFLLQTRSAQRTPWAALQIALDLVDEGMIEPATALGRLAGIDLEGLERVRLASERDEAPLASCTPASIGVAIGPIALDSDRVRAAAAAGRPAVLVREDFATEDIAGIAGAAGVLTARGGRTSHAAVVARQLGKVCLVGCTSLSIDLERRRCRIGERELREGEDLSLDGDAGRVFAGQLAVERERPRQALERVADWRAGCAAA
jgi:pyruvate,orthophosphate dikinase